MKERRSTFYEIQFSLPKYIVFMVVNYLTEAIMLNTLRMQHIIIERGEDNYVLHNYS